MRDRTFLVLELIKNPKIVSAVLQELTEHGWYYEEHLAIISKQDVLDVLKQFLNARLLLSKEIRSCGEWLKAACRGNVAQII